MSGGQVFQQRKQNSVLPPALIKSAPGGVSEMDPPAPDNESKSHPPAPKDPEMLPQEEKGPHDEKETPNYPPTSQPPTCGREGKEVLEPKDESPVGKGKECPYLAEQQDKETVPLPPAISKETVKSDHPPANEVEVHLFTQPPTPVEEKYQQKKQSAQWSPQ